MIVSAARPAGWFAVPAAAGGDGHARPAGLCAGFTLLEILMALALLALLAVATVSISANLVGNTPVTPKDVFWKALNDARHEALTSQQEVRLSFDDKAKAFVVQNGTASQTFPVTGANDKLTVGFLPAQKTNSSVLIGGELMETDALPFVTFYADGTCSPFRAQFRSSGPAQLITIDPWTCSEVLEAPK